MTVCTRNLHYLSKSFVTLNLVAAVGGRQRSALQVKPTESVETDKKIIYFYISPFM